MDVKLLTVHLYDCIYTPETKNACVILARLGVTKWVVLALEIQK